MSLFHPYKVRPQRSWTLEETKIPPQRAWTVEETKIPHRPNSTVRAPRRDFRGAVVVNPSFQQRYNESEEDMEPQVMETPLVPHAHGPHRVTIKRENINVVRECEWDVKSIKDDNFGEKTLLSKKLIALIGLVCVTSIVSLLLTLLILFGSVETRNCSCGGNKGVAGTSTMKSVNDDRIVEVSENITAMNKRLEERILQMEDSNEELHEETSELKMELQEQTARLEYEKILQENTIKNLTDRLESTHRELQLLKDKFSDQMAALWIRTNFTTGQLNRLKIVWVTVNTTAEKTSNLTAKMDQEFKNVKRSVNETIGTLNKVNSSLQGFKSQMNNEMKSVWLNLNQSRKCCTDLTTFLNSFKANVTYRSEKLEARIESEEQKSNNSNKVTEENVRKIYDLETLLNATRQDVREVSRQHLTALWSAGNRTKNFTEEIHRVWTAVNTSQVHLLGTLRKVKDNLTEQLNLTAVLLQASDAALLASLVNVNSSITEKVINVSKMAGPIGPPGYNGSQGLAGPAGSVGPPGPKGSGDFSSCQYKVATETLTPGPEVTTVGLAEPSGKRVLGVSCSTNYAAEYNLLETVHNNARRYSCICRGTSSLVSSFGGQPKTCYLHYWECPLTT